MTKEKDACEDDRNELDSSAADRTQFRHPDGGYGWLVCLASFWCNGTILGMVNTFGVIYPDLLDAYGGTNDKDIAFKTSWVGSLSVGIIFLFSPVASILVDKFGIRPVAFIGAILNIVGLIASSFVNNLGLLYLTYGILRGVGTSLIYVPSLVILGHYFRKRLGVVNGIVTAGSSVFTVTLPFILKSSLTNIGLGHTLQVLAGINALLVVCTLTFKPLINHGRDRATPPGKRPKEPLNLRRCLENSFNTQIWKNKSYVIWVVSMIIAVIGDYFLFVHLVKHARDIMPGKDGEILLVCIGVASGVGRLGSGKLSDTKVINRLQLHQFANAAMGIAAATVPFTTSFEVLLILTMILGLFDGVITCLYAPIAFDLVGQKGAAQAVGFLFGILSLPLLGGPPLAGFLYDRTGNYNIAFWAAGGVRLLGANIMFLIPAIKALPSALHDVETVNVADKDLEDTGDDARGSNLISTETGEKRLTRRRNGNSDSLISASDASPQSSNNSPEQIPMLGATNNDSSV